MIKVKGLTKEFIRKGRDGKMTAKKAVDDLSFEIEKFLACWGLMVLAKQLPLEC